MTRIANCARRILGRGKKKKRQMGFKADPPLERHFQRHLQGSSQQSHTERLKLMRKSET